MRRCNEAFHLFFNLLQLVALLSNVMEQLQSLVVLLRHLDTSLLQAALQTLHTNTYTHVHNYDEYDNTHTVIHRLEHRQ